MKRVGMDAGFHRYDARNGDLSHTSIGAASFESNCDCPNGTSTYRPNGTPPIHPAGTFVKRASLQTVYLLLGPDSNRQEVYRRAISDPSVLRNPYNQLYAGDQFTFKDVITIDDDEMGLYPEGEVLSNPRQLPSNNQPNPDGRWGWWSEENGEKGFSSPKPRWGGGHAESALSWETERSPGQRGKSFLAHGRSRSGGFL